MVWKEASGQKSNSKEQRLADNYVTELGNRFSNTSWASRWLQPQMTAWLPPQESLALKVDFQVQVPLAPLTSAVTLGKLPSLSITPAFLSMNLK